MKRVLVVLSVLVSIFVIPLSVFALSISAPAIEEFTIEFLDTGGQVNVADQFVATPGEAPGSVEFSIRTTIVDPNDPFGGVDLEAALFVDPDPEIVWIVSLFNFSNTAIRTTSRTFTGSFLPEPITGRSAVSSQIESSSSVTDILGDGVTITPFNQSHLAVSEVFNSTESANMGVDIGDAFTTTGSGPIPTQQIGPQFGPVPTTSWDGFRTTISYSLTPRDAAFLVGRTTIVPLPIPGPLLLLGSGLVGFGLLAWRQRRNG